MISMVGGDERYQYNTTYQTMGLSPLRTDPEFTAKMQNMEN